MSSSKRGSSGEQQDPSKSSEIRLSGYLKKLKTMKRKFFVLRSGSNCGMSSVNDDFQLSEAEDQGGSVESRPPSLEYFDSEKKWRSGAAPKRSINLRSCFNINRKLDTRQKFALALYTKDDCFAVVMESEQELEQWLNALIQLQLGEDCASPDERPKPTFEHVWQVTVKNRGLASTKNVLGPHRLCLTSRTLSLVCMNNKDDPDVIDFPLMSIRRLGHSDCFFFMEVGRSAITGAGELWMQTEDIIIAKNMHDAILSAMRSVQREEILPRPRMRSCSANEQSKPVMLTRRQTNAVVPTLPSTSSVTYTSASSVYSGMTREPQTTWFESGKLAYHGVASTAGSGSSIQGLGSYSRSRTVSDGHHSFTPASPGSLACSTDSAGSSSLSIGDESDISSCLGDLRLYGHSVPTDTSLLIELPIKEESVDYEEYMASTDFGGYMAMSPVGSQMSSISPVPVYSARHSAKSSSGGSSVVTPPRKSSISSADSEIAKEGYVEMAPGAVNSSDQQQKPNAQQLHSHSPADDEGYMDMAPGARGRAQAAGEKDGSLERKASTASRYSHVSSPAAKLPDDLVVSGTPSTDMRFSEFQLEKVRAYFSPGAVEDDDRILRSFSIGSRPESNHSRSDKSRGIASSISSTASSNVKASSLLCDQESGMRVRAFSMGSRPGITFGKKPSHKEATISERAPTVMSSTGKKSNSAPVLGVNLQAPSWVAKNMVMHAEGQGDIANDDDLMEMDFPHYKIRTESDHRSSTSSLGLQDKQGSNTNSSTDSLRKLSTGGGGAGQQSRPGSRTSAQRPTKLEMNVDNRPIAHSKISPAVDSRNSLSPISNPRSPLMNDDYLSMDMCQTKNQSPNDPYVDMTVKVKTRSDSTNKRRRKIRSQPIKIQNVPKPSGSYESPNSSGGEYVNIDVNKTPSRTSPNQLMDTSGYMNMEFGLSHRTPVVSPREFESDYAYMGSPVTAKTIETRLSASDQPMRRISLPAIGLGRRDREKGREQPYANISVGDNSSDSSASEKTLRVSPRPVFRNLNYASLDLSGDDRQTLVSPLSSASLNEREGAAQPPYAEIDFEKSDGLRQTSETVLENRHH